jgi:hypothetical protein
MHYELCFTVPLLLIANHRGLLFKEILPGLEPLLSSLRDIANKRRKTVSQVILNILHSVHINMT